MGYSAAFLRENAIAASRKTATASPRLSTFALVLLCCSSFIVSAYSMTDFSANASVSALTSMSSGRSLLQNRFEKCLQDKGVTFYGKSDTGNYEDWRQRTFQAQFLNRYPWYIILPNSEAQVAAAVQCLVPEGWPFVVRSGGHSYSGLSLTNCGVVIDTSNLNFVTINKAAKRITVGAGVRLGPLYYQLWKAGRFIFPGGTCPSVGVSGLLLSGGQGISTRRLSIGSDSVLAARVVLPNGQAVVASPKTNPDLYFAIRGGSGSYGVVTSWNLQVYSHPRQMSALEISWDWSAENAKVVIFKLFNAQPDKWPVQVSLVRLYVDKNSAYKIWLVINYWGSKAALQKWMDSTFFFQDAKPYQIRRFGPTNILQEQLVEAAFGDPNRKIDPESGEFKDARLYSNWGNKSFGSAYVKGKLSWQGAYELAAFADGCGTALAFTFLGGASAKKIRGGSGYDVHKSESCTVAFSAACGTADADVVRMATQFAPYSTGHQYMGYLYKTQGDLFNIFFGYNDNKLKAAKAKYDPTHRLNALAYTCN